MNMISIITITFNAEKTLRRTMESVANQTCRDYEHIVIDGASRDRTLAIARSYEGVRILSESDRGLYDAMNKGIAMARGKYLLFLNAGDTFSGSEVLEAYAERTRKGDDIIFADTQIVDKTGTVLGPRHYSAPARLEKDSFAKGMLICHQAFMVKRSLAPEYDLQYRFSSDYDWTIRCINAADMDKCTNLNMVAINYLSDGLTDRNKYKSLRERYRVMAKHYGHLSALKRHAELVLGIR
ncbi:MAG: glycosyltransferase [Bacteroides sp.]|nr:glycosyltransferase [Bacteroides sp.]